jgi:hypothetical protein
VGEFGVEASRDGGTPTSNDGGWKLFPSTAAAVLASRMANRVVPSDRRGLSDGDPGEVADEVGAFVDVTPEEAMSSNVNLLSLLLPL